MTLADALRFAKQELPALDTAAKETLLLFAHDMQKEITFLLAHDDTHINESLFMSYIKQRKQHIPFEYITHNVNFYGYSFYVDTRCLIPRPETELLVDHAIRLAHTLNAHSILDICTGSGAIACTLQKQLPHCTVSASDISTDALAVAKRNADALQLDIHFYVSDLFSDIIEDYFDILTANPPYIMDDYKLQQNVLYEPHLALFGGKAGTEIVERVLEGFFSRHFRAAVIEIGYDQRAFVERVLMAKQHITYDFYQDYAGFDRGVWIMKEN